MHAGDLDVMSHPSKASACVQGCAHFQIYPLLWSRKAILCTVPKRGHRCPTLFTDSLAPLRMSWQVKEKVRLSFSIQSSMRACRVSSSMEWDSSSGAGAASHMRHNSPGNTPVKGLRQHEEEEPCPFHQGPQSMHRSMYINEKVQ
jgi:hypothetical protein